MSIGGERLGRLLGQLVADDPSVRMAGAAVVTDWAGAADELEKKILVRLLATLAARETERELREEQLNAIHAIFPFALHTRDDIRPLLEVPLEFFGPGADYVTDLVENLEGMQALDAYRELTFPPMAEDPTIRAWQQKLQQADHFYAGIARRPSPDRERPPRPDGLNLVELEVGSASLSPASDWEHHVVAESRKHLTVLRRLHRVMFRHSVQDEVENRLPVMVEDTWVNAPMFGVSGAGWNLAVTCDWTLERHGAVVATSESEAIQSAIRGLVERMIVRFDVDDGLVDPTVGFDNDTVLRIQADTDLDPWTFSMSNMPYVLVGRKHAG